MIYQNKERAPTTLNPVSELYHYGIKNMKWGLQRFQLGDGTWTAEGLARRREREGFGDEDRTQNGRHTKEEVINSGNVKLVNKYRRELTTDELRTAINRIDTERRLDSLMKDASKSLWMKRAERAAAIAKVTAGTLDNAITWATKGNGKVLIDMLNGKTERDALVARFPFSGGDGFCQIECAYIIFNARVGGGGEVLGEVLDIEVAKVLIAGTAVEIG